MNYLGNRRLYGEQRFIEEWIERVKSPKAWHSKLPCEPQEFIEHLREIYHQIPKAIEAVNRDRKIVNDLLLVNLDGRVGKALERRGIAEHAGARYLNTDFKTFRDYEYGKSGYYVLKPYYYWYSPQWLVDAAGTGNRSHIYKQLDDLKDGDPEEIESAIGMLVLGTVP